MADVPNASFDAGLQSWTATGDATTDSESKVDGDKSLRLRRDAVTMPETRILSERFPLAPGVWEWSSSVRHELYSPDASFHVAVSLVFYDASGKELKRKRLAAVYETSGWKKITEQVELPPGAAQAAFQVEYNKTHGDFWLDGLTLTYIGRSVPKEGGDRKVVFQSSRDGHLFYPGDDVRVEMEVNTPSVLEGSQMEFAWELTDYWGEAQAKPQTGSLTAAGQAANGWNRYRATLELNSIPLQTGPYYEIRVALDLGAPTKARESYSFAVLPESSTRNLDPMDSPFGAHTWNATVYEYFPLSARLGIRRCLVFWDWPAEPPYTPKYDSGHARDSRLLWPKQFGMAPYGVLYPAMRLEHGEKPEYSLEALREGVRQSIEKYAKEGLWGFQIGNEPHAFNEEMVKKDVEAYKAIYETIKATDPKIVAIGSAIGPNEAFFKAGFQPWQDVYNVHSYSDLGDLRKNMRQYRELFKKYGGEKPIWSTEIGSKGQGLPRDVIAKDLIRKAVCFFADGGGFFTWFATGGMPNPDGERSGGYSDSMDLYDGRYNMHLPRIDAVGYFHLIDKLGSKKFVKEISYPNKVSGFLFRDNKGECLLVFWSSLRSGDYFINLPDVHEILVTHYDGRSARLNAAGKGIDLRITEAPVLLTFKGSPNSIPEQLTPASVSFATLPESLTQGTSSELVLRLPEDATEAPLLKGPQLWKISQPTLAKNETGATTARFQVEVPADNEARKATFQVTDASKARTELLAVLPIKSRIEVDLLPLPSAAMGTAEVKLILANHSGTPEAVTWKAELINENPMQQGRYNIKNIRPATARIVSKSEDQMTLQPHETKEIVLKLENVDRLSIYKISATAVLSGGGRVQRERLMGGFAKASKAGKAIAVDGEMDDEAWKSTPAYAIDEDRQVAYSAAGAKKWEGPKDLSGTARFLWDENFLYVGVEVQDDVFRNPKQDQAMWNQDGIQFMINPYRAKEESKGRYDYSMGLGQKGRQVWCHMSADPSVPNGPAPGIQLEVKQPDPQNGNMTYEVAIPWSHLAPFQPGPWANLGLGMVINEDDGIGRRSTMDWFEGVHLKETDFVGDVILSP